MVRCSRAVDGEWLEHMPKATIMTPLGSPSWETSTVPFLSPALLLSLSSEHFSSHTNNICDSRLLSQLGCSVVSQEAAAVWGLSGLLKAKSYTEGTQRSEQDRMSRGQTLRHPPKPQTVSLVK